MVRYRTSPLPNLQFFKMSYSGHLLLRTSESKKMRIPLGEKLKALSQPSTLSRRRPTFNFQLSTFNLRLLGLLFLITGMTLGQGKLLTLDDLYHPEDKVKFTPSPPSILRWLKDGEHYVQTKDDGESRRRGLIRVHARTGETSPLYDSPKVTSALARLAGFDQKRAGQLRRKGRPIFSPDESAVLWRYEDDLFYYDFGSDRALRLTRTPQQEREPSFSPDGRKVAYIRDHDLYVFDLRRQKQHRLTRGGHEDLLNGILDWVYQEEIYGRGDFKGYWWSPDSSRIVYLQLDESTVPSFTVVDHIPRHLEREVTRYPKAGDPNPLPRLGVVSSTGDRTRWIDLHQYTPEDLLVVRVGWNGDGSRVVFQAQNKTQTWLDLNLADPRTGRVNRLFRETTQAWVNVLGQPTWIQDGSFLWQSERSGWRHLYHYKATGELIRTVTGGDWEVRTLHGVDEARGWVYVSATRRSHIAEDVYRVRLRGGRLHRLSRREGSHRATFNRQFTFYLDRWSDITTPTQVRLHDSEGVEVRTIFDKPAKKLAKYKLSRPEFHQVKTRDGFVMEAIMIKPSDFDPSRKYPVMSHTYSGPHSPRVLNSWGGTTYLWHQLLAQKGYIIWICDNRTASGKGAESTWPLHRNFGELELRDLEDGLNWLKSHSWIDGDRIGLWGWSFGGYMTSYALTHSKSFKLGIAGAPVTDWHLYDTIYTERYMSTPQENPEGYKMTSVRGAAANLHGKLMIIHGSMDDNVHMQNTIQFVYELQEAGKQFDLMIYPKSGHGVRDAQQVYHMRRMMTDFILENL